MESTRIEGEEDIEICLSDGTFVIAQTKSVVKCSTDFDDVRPKGRMAMKSLSEASQKMSASCRYATIYMNVAEKEWKTLRFRVQ